MRKKSSSFVITKSFNHDKITRETTVEWAKVYHPINLSKVISKADAKEAIEECGLVKVFENEFGEIYDHPNEPFLEEHRGIFEREQSKKARSKKMHRSARLLKEIFG